MPHEYVPRMIDLERPVYLMQVGQVPGQGSFQTRREKKSRILSGELIHV